MKKKKEKSTIPKVKPSDFNKKKRALALETHQKGMEIVFSYGTSDIVITLFLNNVPVIGNIIEPFARYKGGPNSFGRILGGISVF